jgi:nucleotide-binding universal stress UspA family protein
LLAAAATAQRSAARLRILSVLQRPSPANPLFAVAGPGYTEILRLMRRLQTESLERGAADVADHGIGVETELLEGEVVDELLRQSVSLDLLALGSRGYGAVRRVAAGGVSIGVLRGAACPVLILPRGVEDPFGYAEARVGATGGVVAQLAASGVHGAAGGDRR